MDNSSHLGNRLLYHLFRDELIPSQTDRNVTSFSIKGLGGWESIQMIERYTKPVRFEDSLKSYKAPSG